jgi:undecaprenyl-diphosphatase
MRWPWTRGPHLLLEERRRLWIERELAIALCLHRACASRALTLTMVGVSRIGNGAVWYTLIATLPWWGGDPGWTCALYMAALGAVNLVFYKALKQCVARPRPYIACPGICPRCRVLDEFSLPSGHTLHAVSFSLVLAHDYPPLGWPLWGLTALIALSRVVLGLHYPSDVLVGAAIGWTTATFMLVVV